MLGHRVDGGDFEDGDSTIEEYVKKMEQIYFIKNSGRGEEVIARLS